MGLSFFSGFGAGGFRWHRCGLRFRLHLLGFLLTLCEGEQILFRHSVEEIDVFACALFINDQKETCSSGV